MPKIATLRRRRAGAASVTATELANRTAAVLHRVSVGREAVTVERHGRPIVRIVPLSPASDEAAGE